MSEYQVIARKFRPKTFKEVFGQEAIVTTLKNAIKRNRLAQAYLFCGARGTGKTTLARVFAKALNCLNPTEEGEPCSLCSSCREITSGNSLDILEIDGASNRGIEDIRQINETVGYATASGKYKIYIIDEVHMLTKEAFNALLKTLEEPPEKVKFFFATTEPHKILPTILSRCQRFNLNRIPVNQIISKLKFIAEELNISIEEEAIRIIANQAEGGLRDAESLFDQVIAFHEGVITTESLSEILGIMPQERLFALDLAAKNGNLAMAFEMAHQIFSEGKDLGHFIDSLVQHYRNMLIIKLTGKNTSFLTLNQKECEKYTEIASNYSQEQCLTILDYLTEVQTQRASINNLIALETVLLRILRIHQRIPVELLVKKLAELEQNIHTKSSQQPLAPSQPPQPNINSTTTSKPNTPPKPPSTKPISIQVPQSTTYSISTQPPALNQELQSRVDTLLQFAAVELEGTVQRIK